MGEGREGWGGELRGEGRDKERQGEEGRKERHGVGKSVSYVTYIKFPRYI